MERALDESSNPTLDALDFPQLRRLPGLERDLDFYSPDWRATLKPSRATAKYVTRIEEVAAQRGTRPRSARRLSNVRCPPRSRRRILPSSS